MFGLELSSWSVNSNNGSINGEQYFECPPGHGYFAPLNHIISTKIMPKLQTCM